MSNTPSKPPAKPLPAAEPNARALASQAIGLMQKYSVAPTPNHYALWYAYVKNDNPALKHDIDEFIRQSIPFTPNICETLYYKYVVNAPQAKTRGAGLDAQRLLADVLHRMQTFSKEADQYSGVLDAEVKKMASQITHPELRSIVNEIVSSTVALQGTTKNLQDKVSESQKEIEQLRSDLHEATKESQMDFLTRVSNRKAFDLALDEMITNAKNKNGELCLLLIDIDHFKQFNDKFGHLIGDEVLKIVAKTLKDSVKGKDTVARYGGEEFAVLLPETPLPGAMIVAESIRKTIAAHDLKRKDTGQSFGIITVSIGIGRFHGGNDMGTLFIQRADEALYASKAAGRNRVTTESGSLAG